MLMGLNFVAFRYFNAAGCDPDSEIGEDHVPETHLDSIDSRCCFRSKKIYHHFWERIMILQMELVSEIIFMLMIYVDAHINRLSVY